MHGVFARISFRFSLLAGPLPGAAAVVFPMFEAGSRPFEQEVVG